VNPLRVLAALPPEFASGGAVTALASIAFAFYRYVWKPQQDRMDAFTMASQRTLEDRLDKAEDRIESLEKEVEQCHKDRRSEMEHNARMRRALIDSGIPVPDR
jgi:hypothetical protein